MNIGALRYYPRPAEPEAAQNYETSYLGRIGKGCEPVVEPLGLNWKAGVALLSGVAAKEIVVSTVGVLYAETPVTAEASAATADHEDEEVASLGARLLASGDFTRASALAFLVFILLYFPCIATIAATGAEAGWRWAVAATLYNTVLAWVLAWITYNIALLL